MNLATGILTASRPIPTLTGALASLHAAGFPDPVQGHDIARLGNLQNFLGLARVMLCSNADWFLICEDDVTWRENSRVQIYDSITYTIPRDHFGVLSLHCTRRVSRALEHTHFQRGRLAPGIYESYLGPYTWGAQALLFTRASLTAVIDSNLFQRTLRTHRTGLDGTIFGALKELELRAWYLLPCLARHDLGEHNSGILHETPHTSRGCDY